MKKLALQPQQELTVHSASGLVKFNGDFYIIADDDLSLHNITKNISYPLISEELPKDYKERKKSKPDWEALVLLDSGFLVIPSGSKQNRRTGFFVPSNFSEPLPVDFSLVYLKLENTFPNLNIEGASYSKNELKLFQRGNGTDAKNAVISLDAKGILSDIQILKPIQDRHISKITHYSLEKLNGIALGFTDACQNGKDIWFLAVAEDGNSTFDDGAFAGSVLGKIENSGQISTYELDSPTKPEGLWIEKDKFYVVTDADDPEKKSILYCGII